MSRQGIFGWILVTLLLVVVVIQWRALNQSDAMESEQLRQTRHDLMTAEESLVDVRQTLAQREERFESMSHACARLINEYVTTKETLLAAAGDFYNGRDAEALDLLEGWMRSQADADYFIDQDRAGCGMEFSGRYRKNPDLVQPIPLAWREGADQPEF